jgi:hypothetical protein
MQAAIAQALGTTVAALGGPVRRPPSVPTYDRSYWGRILTVAAGRGLTGRGLSLAAGYGKNAIAKWRSRGSKGPPEARERIASVLGVSIAEMEGGL